MSQWICKNPSHLTSRNRVTSLFSSLCNEFSIRLKSCIWTNLWKQRFFVQMRLTWLLGHNAYLEKIKHTSAKKPHTNCHRWWWRADDVALFCSPSLGALQPVSSPWTLLYSKIFWSGNYKSSAHLFKNRTTPGVDVEQIYIELHGCGNYRSKKSLVTSAV